MAISARNDGEWQPICEVIQRPELAEDSRFATIESRMQDENQDALDEILEAWTATRTDFEAMDALAGEGCGGGGGAAS